jgi:hypothetical protein
MSLTTTSGVATVGNPITLHWSSTATTCTASGDWSGAKAGGGSSDVTIDHTAAFTLNCGGASATVRVEVIGTNSRTTPTVAYSSTGLTMLSYVILPIDVRGQVYDAANNLIHAITTADSGSYPQSIVSIDPTAGQVVASSPLAAGGWILAVSADGQYLYVASTAIKGAPIQRYKVAGLAPDLSIPIDSTESLQAISVSPASPTTLAVTGEAAVGTLGTSLSQLQIFDGATPRTDKFVVPPLLGETLLRAVWTSDATKLVVPGHGLRTFAVNSQGVSLLGTTAAGGAYDGRLSGGIFYDDGGNVIDAAGPVTLLGQFSDVLSNSGTRIENLSINKTYSLDTDSIANVYLSSFDATRFRRIDFIQIPLATGYSGPLGGALISWGSDGVAWNEGGSLVIAHGSFAQQGGSLATPQSLPAIAAGNPVENAAVSYVIYDVQATDIAVDKCGNLYTGIADSSLLFGNSVLSFNAMSGSLSASNYATSYPRLVQAAPDCSAVYVGSGSSNSIVRLSPPALTSSGTIPLVESPTPPDVAATPIAFASSLSVAPNDANTIAVAMNFGSGLCNSSDYGLAVYDGATRRPDVMTRGTLSAPKGVAWGKDSSTLYVEDWDGIKAVSVDSSGPGQATLLVPYSSLEGDTAVYDLHNNVQYDAGKSRILTGEGGIYDLASATALPRLPVTASIGDCGLWGAITSDQQSGKIFHAEFEYATNFIELRSFDSQTLKQIDKVTVPVPSGLSSMGGPRRIVHLANTNIVALVTSSGYIVALQGPMFAP